MGCGRGRSRHAHGLLGAWVGIELLQFLIGALSWSPADQGTRTATALLASSSSWLAGPVLAMNFGPHRHTTLAIVLFAVGWFVSLFAGFFAALVMGSVSI